MSALKPFLTNIANAIREKKQTTEPIPAQSFANEILSIQGGSAVTDTPLTITSNGTTEAPDGVRYTPITVEVPKPTLNAPLISVNVSNAVLNVSDYRNGNFTQEYLLYRNGEQVNTFTSKSINLTEYMTVNGDETIQVKSKGNEFFNESALSNAIEWDLARDGTAGLTYSGEYCTGIGSATADVLYIASVVGGITITTIYQGAFTSLDGKTLIIPDTITGGGRWWLNDTKNSTVVFGANMGYLANESLKNFTNVVVDFRKATKIPQAPYGNFGWWGTTIAIVPDNLYDEWIVATNWSKEASRIIRATDYEAQGGAV